MSGEQPSIQPIVNLVVQGSDGRVLLVRYGPDGGDDPDTERRWWLPGRELEPYQHPDAAADLALDEIDGLTVGSSGLACVQSFRGRRGWHLTFDYLVVASGTPTPAGVPAAWHDIDDLPRTMHGNWERDTIHAVLEAGAPPSEPVDAHGPSVDESS